MCPWRGRIGRYRSDWVIGAGSGEVLLPADEVLAGNSDGERLLIGKRDFSAAAAFHRI